jgi:hypothetical protein
VIVDLPFVNEALLDIEAAAEKAGWDRPDCLYALCKTEMSGEVSAVEVKPFPGFELAVHLTGHSFYALQSVSAAVPIAPASIRAEWSGLMGLVLVDESWMVKVKEGEPHPTGSLADHPDRIEQRFVWLLGADGSSKTLTRARGKDPEWIAEWTGGRLVDATRELLTLALED